MKNALVRWHGHIGLRRFNDALDVKFYYRPWRASKRNHAFRADIRDLSAAKGDRDFFDVLANHVLSVADGLLHRTDSLV